MTASEVIDEELAAAFERHRRELHVHCYRMTGSFTTAEDLTDDTFLRAWQARDTFERRASMRTWLYRIATNVSLDHLKRHERRTSPIGRFDDPLECDALLQPYPDALLWERSEGDDPLDLLCRRRTTELVFIAALSVLPPRQRAAFIARDVLEYSAADTAGLLDTTVASANSLTQRARGTLRQHLGGSDLGLHDDPTLGARADVTVDDDVVHRYVEAHLRGDAAAIIEMVRDDVRVTMPPEPPCLGSTDAAAFFTQLFGPDRPGDWLLVPTRMNGRSAAACYLRRPGDERYRATSIDVLEVRDGRLAVVNCFLGDELFPFLGLPPERLLAG